MVAALLPTDTYINCQTLALFCRTRIITKMINDRRLGGVTVRASDLRSSGRGFDSQSCRYRTT